MLGTIAYLHTTTGNSENNSYLSALSLLIRVFFILIILIWRVSEEDEEDEDLEEDEEDDVSDEILILILNRTDPLGHFGSVGQSSSMSLSSIWWTSTGSGVISFALANLASQSSMVPISAGAMSTPPECLWLISCFSR